MVEAAVCTTSPSREPEVPAIPDMTPPAATQSIRDFVRKIAALQLKEPKCRPLRDALELYLDSLKDTANSTATVSAYAGDLRQFVGILESLGADSIGEVDNLYIAGWRKSMAGLANTTVCRRMASVSCFFEWLMTHELADHNPLRGVKRPRKLTPDVTVLTFEHFRELLSACDTIQERAIIGILFWGGLRREEVVDLDTADVDLTAQIIKVHGKGGDEGIVHIMPALHPLLEEQLRGRILSRGDEPLFRNRKGDRISRRLVSRVFHSLCVKAKLKGHAYTPHSSRRGIAQLMEMQGFPFTDIQRHLRHKDVATTLKYLRNAHERIKERAAENPIFGGCPKPAPTVVQNGCPDSRFEQIAALSRQITALLEEVGYPLPTATPAATSATDVPPAAEGPTFP